MHNYIIPAAMMTYSDILSLGLRCFKTRYMIHAATMRSAIKPAATAPAIAPVSTPLLLLEVGFPTVASRHPGSVKLSMATGQVGSMLTLIPCNTKVGPDSIHCMMYDIKCDVLAVSVP